MKLFTKFLLAGLAALSIDSASATKRRRVARAPFTVAADETEQSAQQSAAIARAVGIFANLGAQPDLSWCGCLRKRKQPVADDQNKTARTAAHSSPSSMALLTDSVMSSSSDVSSSSSSSAAPVATNKRKSTEEQKEENAPKASRTEIHSNPSSIASSSESSSVSSSSSSLVSSSSSIAAPEILQQQPSIVVVSSSEISSTGSASATSVSSIASSSPVAPAQSVASRAAASSPIDLTDEPSINNRQLQQRRPRSTFILVPVPSQPKPALVTSSVSSTASSSVSSVAAPVLLLQQEQPCSSARVVPQQRARSLSLPMLPSVAPAAMLPQLQPLQRKALCMEICKKIKELAGSFLPEKEKITLMLKTIALLGSCGLADFAGKIAYRLFPHLGDKLGGWALGIEFVSVVTSLLAGIVGLKMARSIVEQLHRQNPQSDTLLAKTMKYASVLCLAGLGLGAAHVVFNGCF